MIGHLKIQPRAKHVTKGRTKGKKTLGYPVYVKLTDKESIGGDEFSGSQLRLTPGFIWTMLLNCITSIMPGTCTLPAADPGFPQGGGGAPTPQGGGPTYDFVKFSRKLHEIERIWVPMGAVCPSRPLNPPLPAVPMYILPVWYPTLGSCVPCYSLDYILPIWYLTLGFPCGLLFPCSTSSLPST